MGVRQDTRGDGLPALRDVGDTAQAPTVYWVLVRRAGVQTPSNPPDECPECGAPSTHEETFCRYCTSACDGWILPAQVSLSV